MPTYETRPITPVYITGCICVIIAMVVLGCVVVLHTDLVVKRQEFILALAKNAARPDIRVDKPEYMVVYTGKEILMDSGVTEVKNP
uniref:Uncharacterized protein n=1 Tax=viral metagenome TaxID=1070528 RepID=A0A6M3INC9_9ZZZZ